MKLTLSLFFVCFLSISLFSNGIENCIDCGNMIEKEYTEIQYKPTVLYECAKNVKVYLQKYTCKDCGYFEVSVRDTSKINTKGSCNP